MGGICERRHAVVFLALVACFVVLASECIRSNPVLVDEYGHVPVGVSYWETGYHYLYRENPPFVRLLASFPVWLSNAKTDYARASRAYRSEWHVGMDFITANGARHHEYFGMARSVVLFLAVVCALAMFENAIDRVGQTIYIFRVVPRITEGETTKAITYDELRASFREVTLRDRRTYTLL